MGISSLQKPVATQDLSKLGIISALPAEAACLYNGKLNIGSPIEIQKDIFLCLSGMGYESASNAARKCLEIKVDALISWGVAGAIESSLNSGDLIFAESIIGQHKTYQTTTEWNKKLLAYFQKNSTSVISGDIASSKEICASVTDKKLLLDKTGAIAVDMESAAIAEIAKNNNLDFIVIRTIADKAATTIPEAVLNHTDNLGKPEILKFMLSCMSKPAQISDIAKLAKSYKMALKTLSNIASDLKSQNFFYV